MVATFCLGLALFSLFWCLKLELAWRAAAGVPSIEQVEFSPAGAPPQPGGACLDVERGIRQIGGSRELYLDLLHRFACEFGATPASLGAEIGRGNLAGAALLANSVQEIAGVLAALPLEGAAAELVRALSGDRSRIEASLACFGHQLAAVLRSAA